MFVAGPCRAITPLAPGEPLVLSAAEFNAFRTGDGSEGERLTLMPKARQNLLEFEESQVLPEVSCG